MQILEELGLLVPKKKPGFVATTIKTPQISYERLFRLEPDYYAIYEESKGDTHVPYTIVVNDWRLRYGRPYYNQRSTETFLFRLLLTDFKFHIYVPTKDGMVKANNYIHFMKLLDEMTIVRDLEAKRLTASCANKTLEEVLVLSVNTLSPILLKLYELNRFERFYHYDENNPPYYPVNMDGFDLLTEDEFAEILRTIEQDPFDGLRVSNGYPMFAHFIGMYHDIVGPIRKLHIDDMNEATFEMFLKPADYSCKKVTDIHFSRMTFASQAEKD